MKWMKSPFLIALSLGALSLLIAAAPLLWRMLGPAPPPSAPSAAQDAPWQVATPSPGSSRVFGLSLPGSTLADLRQRWGSDGQGVQDVQVAVIMDASRRLSLEAYVEQFNAGGLAARLVAVFDAPQPDLTRWREATPGQPTGTGAWRHRLAGSVLAEADAAPLIGLTLIPAAQLDADTLTARFGPPAERLPGGERLSHWLYPAIGLAVALDSQGKEVLQYVAPAQFEDRLAAPLRRP